MCSKMATWVFLDVDGVLNCNSTKEVTPNGFAGVEGKKIALLADFVHEMGARIVLTSTWKDQDLWIRELHPGADLVYLLGRLAVYDIEIDAYTRDGDRSRAVRDWMDVHPGLYVIFDDSWAESYADAGITRYLVQTTMARGLQSKHIRRARQILEMQRKEMEGRTSE